MRTVATRVWFVAALLVTVGLSVAVLVLPLAAYQVNGGPVHYRSLLAGEGSDVVLPLAVPVLLCAAPLLAPARARRVIGWTSAVLLSAGVLVSLLSIGALFVPSVLLLAMGARRSP